MYRRSLKPKVLPKLIFYISSVREVHKLPVVYKYNKCRRLNSYLRHVIYFQLTSFFGRRLLLRAICGGLSSVFSGLSAGLLVHLYSLSGGPDAGRSFLQLYLPVAAYALIFICGAFLLIKNALAREAEPDI